ncbi:hypothetical protein SAMN05421777_101153 [Fluoribacter gormanii]|uniref:Uncharacterized protein n=1 Tax=Fluoribacter gormanii TaxID=464 RepID=A0A377GIN9_9GAMM|nr:hypothetical protein SAMN05421777_101153 [Fluoribacter gormanii]STO24454.1 Uncharacterised protein [Fluoribacter gormanii]
MTTALGISGVSGCMLATEFQVQLIWEFLSKRKSI